MFVRIFVHSLGACFRVWKKIVENFMEFAAKGAEMLVSQGSLRYGDNRFVFPDSSLIPR